MSFTISKQGYVSIVDVEGQLIVGNRQELKQKVLDELEKGAGPGVRHLLPPGQKVECPQSLFEAPAPGDETLA